MQPRVVLLSAFLSPFRSGAEACSEEVSTALQHAYDIIIVTAKLRRNLPRHDKLPSGVRVIRVGFGTSFDKWLFPFLGAFTAARLQPKLIHAVLESYAGLALHLCRFTCPFAKRLLTLQTTNTSFLKKMIMRSPHSVTAISSVLRKRAEAIGRKGVWHIPNGIDTAAFQKAREAYTKVEGRILFVGRLEPMKGIDTLLDAFAVLAEEFPHAQLRIVGDGSLRDELPLRYPSLVESSRIVFVGRIPPQDIAKEYATAQIFCGLSRSEALGNVFIEAQAAGCAVLGTQVDGIPDTVRDNVTGILIPPNDIAAATEVLADFLKDPALRERLGSAAIENAQYYDWEAIAKRYSDVYASLIR